jgi:hypothetical protein
VSHWYNRAGEAVFEVPKAVRWRHPQRRRWLTPARWASTPASPPFWACLDKPQLTDWKLEQVSLACFNCPPTGGEPL